MEIRDWLRAAGDRARLLVIIPLAAALIAALIGIISPTQYHSTATVFLPEVSTGGAVTTAVAQRVADFSAAVKSPAVKESVAAETGVEVSSLGEVTVERGGQSGVVLVGFSGSDPDVVPAVAEALARGALRLEAQANLDRAVAQLQGAESLAEDADDEYQEFVEGGAAYTEELLTTYVNRYTEWSDELNSRIAESAPQAEIDEAQAAVDRNFNRLTEMQDAQDAYNRKRSAEFLLGEANADVVEAEGDLTVADTLQIAATQATPQSKLKDVAQKTLFAGVFGFVLAAGLVVLLVLIQGQRPGSGATEEPAPALFPRRAAGRT